MVMTMTMVITQLLDDNSNGDSDDNNTEAN